MKKLLLSFLLLLPRISFAQLNCSGGTFGCPLPSSLVIAATNGGTGNASYTANNLIYAPTTTTIGGLATGNNGVLVTSSGGAPSISSTIPSATQDNITRLGTITSGAWSGTAITNAKGGTGQDTSSSTGLPYVSSGTWSVSTTQQPTVAALVINGAAASAAAGYISLGQVAVASLPTSGTANAGQIIMVNDSTDIAIIGQTCAGGGTGVAVAMSVKTGGTFRWACF